MNSFKIKNKISLTFLLVIVLEGILFATAYNGMENVQSVKQSQNNMIIVLIFSIIITALLGLFLIKLICKPMKELNNLAESIENGNFNEDLDVKVNDEIGKLANSLKKILKSINNLADDSNLIMKSAEAGDFNINLDESKYGGSWREISENNISTANIFIKKIKKTSDYIGKISVGEIDNKYEEEEAGEFNIIKNNINKLIDNLNSFQEDIHWLKDTFKAGNTRDKIDGSKFSGIYKEMSECINDTTWISIDVFLKLFVVIKAYSQGDFSVELEKLPGRYGLVNEYVEDLRGNLLNISKEQINIINEIKHGDLSKRTDASKFNGSWAEMIQGINELIEVIIKPIEEVISVMSEMSKGNLEVSINGDYQGEFGVLGEAINKLGERLRKIVKEISEVTEKVSMGDLNIGAIREFTGDFKGISTSLNIIVDSLNSVISEINTSSEQVFAGANEVSTGSQILSQGATEQASAIEQLTASISEVAVQTKGNSDNANKAKDLALKVKVNAEEGNKHMGEMLESMNQINESSTNISKIIKVIDEIAFQTNILALNAAVEAARAGQHGKGFAVVAEEVRNLAARSANAAKETTTLIEGSMKKAEIGSEIANNTAKALYEIVDGVSKAATLVSEIAAASEEQTSGLAQINVGIEQVSQVVQTNSATAEESASASEELSSQAKMLNEMVSSFKLKNDNKNGQLNNNRQANMIFRKADEKSNKTKIILSDQEFGKY